MKIDRYCVIATKSILLRKSYKEFVVAGKNEAEIRCEELKEKGYNDISMYKLTDKQVEVSLNSKTRLKENSYVFRKAYRNE